MNKPEITAYLKTSCGWSKGVRALLAKYDLPYTEKDIIINPEYRAEMVKISEQTLSPTVVVNGVVLPDISGEELERFMVQHHLIEYSDEPAAHPMNASCSH